MQKTLRILQKDTRHLWPEILLTLGLTLGFAATDHFLWPHIPTSDFPAGSTIAIWMNALMPIAWWLLIARAVHDESLVGDIQFWVTRPYGWQRILGAKLLFIAAYIVLPFFLAQIFLLHQASLHPGSVLPGVLLKLLLLFAFILLPLLALSTVTPSLTRMLLLFLAVIIYALLVGYINSLFGRDATDLWSPSAGNFHWGWLSLILLPVIPAIVTLLQYARRRTPISAGLLIALVVALTVALIAGTRRNTTATDFPSLAPGEPAPMQIALNPDPAWHTSPATPLVSGQPSVQDLSRNRLSIPIVISNIAPNHAVTIEGLQATFPNAPGGLSNWRFNSGRYTKTTQVRELLDYFPDTPLGSPLTVHLTYAVTELEAVSTAPVTFNAGPIDIPQHGRCIVTIGATLTCHFALAAPETTRIAYRLKQSCSADSPSDRDHTEWIGSQTSSPQPNFSPVVADQNLSTLEIADNHAPLHLCPGSTLTFTRYHVIGHHRVETTLAAFDPRDYIDHTPDIE